MNTFKFSESLSNYQGIKKQGLTAPQFGYSALNYYIPGILPGSLTVIGGGTSMGKTTFLSNVAYSVAKKQNRGVLFFSLESGHSISGVINSFSKSQDIPKLKIVVPTSTMTLAVFEKIITENPEYCELVILDHIHYLADIKSANQSASVGEIIRKIQMIAKKYMIPIIVVSHIRKLADDTKIPQMTDLKDSSALYQDPSTVLLIHRFKNEIKSDNIGQTIFTNHGLLVVAKNRDYGKTGILKLEYNPDKLQFAVEDEWVL